MSRNERFDASSNPLRTAGIDRMVLPAQALSTLPSYPRRLEPPFDEPALTRPDDWQENCLRQNLKRMLYIPTALLGIAWGVGFSSLVQNKREAPLWAELLRLSAISTLPHLIPSILGLLSADEPSVGLIFSDVPVTLRWVTRGTENSHNARIATEMAYKKMLEANHQNFILQIVTDEKHTDDNGDRIHSFVTLAESQGQIPEYVHVLVVPDAFHTTNQTRKKGRALAYAALCDRHAKESVYFYEHINDLLISLESDDDDSDDRLSNSIEGNALHTLAILLEKIVRFTNTLREAGYHPDDNALGKTETLARLLHHLPTLLNNLNSAILEETSTHVALHELKTWKLELSAILDQLPSRDHVKTDSGIFHLDEESQITHEVLSGINHFVNQHKTNAWRLGQGKIAYADAANRNAECFDLQARLCQLLDSIRIADDYARFYWQFRNMNQILFGAKGSFLYLPQLFEQDFELGFDGGEHTSITEDACMAFNMAPAIEKHYQYITTQLEEMRVAFSLKLQDAIETKDFLSLDHLPHDLSLALLTLLDEVALKNAYASDVHQLVEHLREAINTTYLSDEAHVKKCQEIVAQSLNTMRDEIDNNIHARFLCMQRTLDCGWITGTLHEQSPFTIKEFLLQRKRWISGLFMLAFHHQHISTARRIIFSIALIGWIFLQLSAVALIAPFITFDKSSNPIQSTLMGFIGSTYLFMYSWGWFNQLHDSARATLAGIPLIPFVQMAALLFFESVPAWLALCFRDVQFVLVDKYRGIAAFCATPSELPSHTYQSFLNYETYLAQCKEQGITIPPHELPKSPDVSQQSTDDANEAAQADDDGPSPHFFRRSSSSVFFEFERSRHTEASHSVHDAQLRLESPTGP